MNIRTFVSLALTLAILASAFGQQPAPSPTPSVLPTQSLPGEDDVVRISANLVQVDAVVTDKQGHQITDLTDQDFEVLEDGRPQKISNLSYITTSPAAAATAT